MTVYQLYGLAFLGLSGLGVVYLNPESILALCFFIFFGLILQNSDSAGQSLETTRQALRDELVRGMLENQRHGASLQLNGLWQSLQLNAGLKVI